MWFWYSPMQRITKITIPRCDAANRNLPKDGTNCPPSCCMDAWRPSEREFRQSGRNVPHYPVNPLQEGRTLQALLTQLPFPPAVTSVRLGTQAVPRRYKYGRNRVRRSIFWTDGHSPSLFLKEIEYATLPAAENLALAAASAPDAVAPTLHHHKCAPRSTAGPRRYNYGRNRVRRSK